MDPSFCAPDSWQHLIGQSGRHVRKHIFGHGFGVVVICVSGIFRSMLTCFDPLQHRMRQYGWHVLAHIAGQAAC
jgi:hypothetical protein